MPKRERRRQIFFVEKPAVSDRSIFRMHFYPSTSCRPRPPDRINFEMYVLDRSEVDRWTDPSVASTVLNAKEEVKLLSSGRPCTCSSFLALPADGADNVDYGDSKESIVGLRVGVDDGCDAGKEGRHSATAYEAVPNRSLVQISPAVPRLGPLRMAWDPTNRLHTP